jgi:hypothetical protein
VAGKQMKSFSNQIKMLWNNVKVLSISIGEQLAPKIMMLGNYVKDTISAWNSLSETTKSIITNLAIFAAAIGPLAVGISVLIKFVSMLGVAIAAIAAGAPAAVLILTAAVTIGLVMLVDKFADAVSGARAFNAELERIGASGAKTIARLGVNRSAKLASMKEMPAGPEREENKAAAMERAREQLKVYQRDVQRKNLALQEASKGQNWIGEWTQNERIFARAKAEQQKSEAKYKAALDYYKALEDIGKEDTAKDINEGLAEIDRMDTVISRIADYTKEQQKLAATVGMTEAQVKLWEFAQEGATEAMLAEARAASLLTEALERTNKAKETGIAMMEEYLTPLEKFQKKQSEIMQLLMVGAIGKKTADRASLAANKEYKDAEKALLELQAKANIRINYDFMNNKAVEEGTDEFYRLMQLVPEARISELGGGGGGAPKFDFLAEAAKQEELERKRVAERDKKEKELLARIEANTRTSGTTIIVKSAGL